MRPAVQWLPPPEQHREALLGATKRKRKEPAPGRRPRWIDTARELGINSAAITLGEVREELADILSEGLSALTSVGSLTAVLIPDHRCPAAKTTWLRRSSLVATSSSGSCNRSPSGDGPGRCVAFGGCA